MFRAQEEGKEKIQGGQNIQEKIEQFSHEKHEEHTQNEEAHHHGQEVESSHHHEEEENHDSQQYNLSRLS